jgi:cell division protein FtsW
LSVASLFTGLGAKLWSAKSSGASKDDWASGDALPVRVHGAQFTATSSMPVRFSAFDQPLVFVTLALMLWGLVMVYLGIDCHAR